MAVELSVAYFDIKSELGEANFGGLVEDAINLSCEDLHIAVQHFRKTSEGGLITGIKDTIIRMEQPVDVVMIETERFGGSELRVIGQVSCDLLGAVPVVVVTGLSEVDQRAAKRMGISAVIDFSTIDLPAGIDGAEADDLYWSATVGLVHDALKAQSSAIAA